MKKLKLLRNQNLQVDQYINDFYYVTYFTESYEPIVRTLISSLEKFSKRKCILYTVNYTAVQLEKEISNQFIIRRIDLGGEDHIDNRGRSFNTITSKPIIQLAALEAYPNKKLIFIDTDIYATVSIDSIIKYFDQLENYPLTNSHVHDVIYMIMPNGERISSLKVLGDEIGVPINLFPRRKTNVMIFDERSKWFFEEQMKIYNDNKNSTTPYIFSLHDEDTFNIVLNKHNLYKVLPVIDIEEVFDIDLTIFDNYSYNISLLSGNAIFAKSDRDILVFHGYKTVEEFKKVEDIYCKTVLTNKEISIEYNRKNKLITIIKDPLLFNKNISNRIKIKVLSTLGVNYMAEVDITSSNIFHLSNCQLKNNTLYTFEFIEMDMNRLVFRTDMFVSY